MPARNAGRNPGSPVQKSEKAPPHSRWDVPCRKCIARNSHSRGVPQTEFHKPPCVAGTVAYEPVHLLASERHPGGTSLALPEISATPGPSIQWPEVHGWQKNEAIGRAPAL